MLSISLRDSDPENFLSPPMICEDITSSLTICQQIVTAPAPLIFLLLLPHSKPLESNAQTHTNEIISKGRKSFHQKPQKQMDHFLHQQCLDR